MKKMFPVLSLFWLAMMVAPQAAYATKFSLFDIERSTNANVVHYVANVKDGAFRPDAPISAYWIMRASGGGHESLNWLEREQAYGFDVAMGPSRRSLELTLRALESRPIQVTLTPGGPRVQMRIHGAPALLRRVFVDAGGGLIPNVEYVRLDGVDLASGKPVSEKITP